MYHFTLQLREEIQKTRKLTDKPFGVNLTLLPSLRPPNYEGYCDVIISEKIPVVETAGANPSKFIELFKKAGIVVIHKCVTIKNALSAQRMGADIISMDGYECGGHPGEGDTGNWVLAPLAKKYLTIPFIISGGCATGSQLAAALCLGAQGMNLGTRMIATKEAPVQEGIKNAIVNMGEKSTTIVMRSVKNTERVFRNSYTDKVQAIEDRRPGDFNAIRPYVAGINYKKAFQETGDPDECVWSCGQSGYLVDSILSCKDLIDMIVRDADEILRSVAGSLQPTNTSTCNSSTNSNAASKCPYIKAKL